MRLLVCGGRHFEGAENVYRELDRLHRQEPIAVLIHGNVTGLGIAAEAWARRNGAAIVRYPPNWEFYGKKAEGLRNAFMIEDSRPDLVLAFQGGRHTADLIHRAVAAKVAVRTIPAGGLDGALGEIEGVEDGPSPSSTSGGDIDPASPIRHFGRSSASAGTTPFSSTPVSVGRRSPPPTCRKRPKEEPCLRDSSWPLLRLVYPRLVHRRLPRSRHSPSCVTCP